MLHDYTNKLIKLTLSVLVSLLCIASLSPVTAQGVEYIGYLKSPRASLEKFRDEMERSLSVAETNPDLSKKYLKNATLFFNLDKYPMIIRPLVARDAALLMKEILDRLDPVLFERLPDDVVSSENIQRWKIPTTPLLIEKREMSGGAAIYQLTFESVLQLRIVYEDIREKPYLSGIGANYHEMQVLKDLPLWLQYSVLETSLWQWIGFGAFSLVMILFYPLVWNILRRIEVSLVRRYHINVFKPKEGMSRPSAYMILVGEIYIALQLLGFRGDAMLVANMVLSVAFNIILVWLSIKISDYGVDIFKKKAKSMRINMEIHLLDLMVKSVKLLFVTIVILFGIQNLGINIVSIMAGLGLGGLAFALAAKDTAANLFGSITIIFDKPFVIGDWIVINGMEGVVEEIGLRSTRIRTFYDSLVTIPNMNVVNSNIDNLGARKSRRIKTFIGLRYDTPSAKVESFNEGVRELLRSLPEVKQDNKHVVLQELGSDSLSIMLYFFLNVKNWEEELKQRENILLRIKELAKSHGVSFAFPSRSLYIESSNDGGGPVNNRQDR